MEPPIDSTPDSENEKSPLLASGQSNPVRSSFRSHGASFSGTHRVGGPQTLVLGSGTAAAPPLLRSMGSHVTGSGACSGVADAADDRPRGHGGDDCGGAGAGAGGVGDDDDDEDSLVIANTTKRWAKLVLPVVVVSYFIGYITSMVIMGPYIYDRIAEEYDDEANTSSQVPCVKDMHNVTGNTSGKQIQDEIERRVSTQELYLHLTTFLTAAIPVLLLGPFTDRFGRKAGFLLPISCTLLKQIVYIVVVAAKLPVPFLYLAHAIEAVGGSFAAMLSAIFSVISDVTRPGKERSGWIPVMEALQTLSASLGQVAVAQWMRYDYLSPLICAMALCVLALCLAGCLLPETNVAAARNRSARGGRLVPAAGRGGHGTGHLVNAVWMTVRTGFTLYTSDKEMESEVSHPPRILGKRRLCLAIFILTVAVNFSSPGVTALFWMKYPLCWPATKVFTVNGLRIFLSWVAILISLALMQKLFKMVDRQVAIVGVVSSIICNVAMSLAVKDVMVFEAAVLGVMTRSIVPMLRSILSSLVGHAKQGAMYSVLGCIETIGASVFSTAANRIYSASLSTWAGEIFMIFAAIMVVALVLLIILNVLCQRDPAPAEDDARGTGNIQEIDGDWSE